MKKLYLLSISLFAAGVLFAQTTNNTGVVKHEPRLTFTPPTNQMAVLGADRTAGDIIWSDDFSTPANWVAGGTSPDYAVNGWSISNTTGGGFYFPAGNMGTTGNFAKFINGATSGAAIAGPFTFTYTGAIDDLTGVPAPHLEFEQYGARFITVQKIQVSTDGGTNWIDVASNEDIDPLTLDGGAVYPQPQTRSFNMTNAIVGDPSNVSIRLFWDGAMNGGSMNYVDYGWFVDNIRIVEGHSYDNDIQAAFVRAGVGGSYPGGLDYFRIPESQLSPLSFSGITTNQGALTHTGVQLTATVNKSVDVFTGTSAPVNIAPGATDSVGTTTQYTPDAGTGTYNVTWEFAGTNPEGITTNDTRTSSFMVTTHTYGRDNNVQTGSIGNVTSNPGGALLIGNTMDIFQDGVIGALDIRISGTSTNVGQDIYGQIARYDDVAGEWVVLDATADREIVTSNLNSFVRVTFQYPVEVFAGDLILVMAGHYGGIDGDEVRFSYAQPVEEQTVLGFTGGGSNSFSLLSPNAIMVRADMRDFTGIEETDVAAFAVGQNIPNPFNNATVIPYSLNTSANVVVEFVDVTGKLVKTITPGTQEAGSYTITLDANELAEGVYFYTFTIGDQRITKQMVVTK